MATTKDKAPAVGTPKEEAQKAREAQNKANQDAQDAFGELAKAVTDPEAFADYVKK